MDSSAETVKREIARMQELQREYLDMCRTVGWHWMLGVEDALKEEIILMGEYEIQNAERNAGS